MQAVTQNYSAEGLFQPWVLYVR